MIPQNGGYIMCDWVLKMDCQPLHPNLTLFASGLRCAKFIPPQSSPPSTFISQYTSIFIGTNLRNSLHFPCKNFPAYILFPIRCPQALNKHSPAESKFQNYETRGKTRMRKYSNKRFLHLFNSPLQQQIFRRPGEPNKINTQSSINIWVCGSPRPNAKPDPFYRGI
jgi:hypothetical protein